MVKLKKLNDNLAINLRTRQNHRKGIANTNLVDFLIFQTYLSFNTKNLILVKQNQTVVAIPKKRSLAQANVKMESATGDGLADAMKNMQNDPGKFRTLRNLKSFLKIFKKIKII